MKELCNSIVELIKEEHTKGYRINIYAVSTTIAIAAALIELFNFETLTTKMFAISISVLIVGITWAVFQAVLLKLLQTKQYYIWKWHTLSASEREVIKEASKSNWTITCTIQDRTIDMLCEKGLLIIPKQLSNGFEEIVYATEFTEKMYEYIKQKEG